MKIVIVCDFGYVNGGAPKVAITEAIALAESGYDVTYFTGVGPCDERLLKAGIRIICMDQMELKEQLHGIRGKVAGAVQGLWNRSAEKAFSALLKKYDPKETIVHFHGWSLALSPALFRITARTGYKIAITCHDYEMVCPVRTYFDYRREVLCLCNGMSMRCILRNCDKRSYAQKLYRVMRNMLLIKLLERNKVSLICLSAFNKKIIERDLGFECEKYIVPNLIDIPPKVETHPEKGDAYLFIGRFTPEKGIHLFCEAVKKAHVRGVAIGNGEDLEKLRREYPEVYFSGWLSPEEMVRHIMHSRCLILPSLWYEGAPLTVPEIQCAYALPCIVPTPCGAQEYIEHGETGFIFRSGDLEDLLKCIEKCKDDALIERMHNNCMKINDSCYSKELHVKRLIEAYKDILYEVSKT